MIQSVSLLDLKLRQFLPIRSVSTNGGFMSKVIDLVPRLKTVADPQSHQIQLDRKDMPHMDDEKSGFKPIILKERRVVDRTILSDMVSGMIVLPQKGLLKVQLFDISEEGLSFVLEPNMGSYSVGEEVALRVYLNHKTYFPLYVKIKHATFDTHENVARHGVEYVKGDSDVALRHFVNFIISVSEGLKIDDGDLMIGSSS